ncbi:MAG: hypothetical protein AB7H88_05360 [Vicinamibacterales bacterium]
MFSLGSFVAGALATVIAKVFGRPMVVTAVSYGYEATDAAAGLWDRTTAEVAAIRDEARAMRDVRQSQSTIAALRREVADLKAELASG